MLNKLKIFSGIFATTCIVLGTLVVLAWIYDFPFLQEIKSRYILMKMNTALSFILLGIAVLIFKDKKELSSLDNLIILAFCVIIITVNVLTVCQYTFNWHYSIDKLLINDPSPDDHSASGRISIIIVLNLCFSALALIIQTFRPASYVTFQSFIFFVFLTSVLSFSAHLYGAVNYYGIASYIKMPLLSTISFISISLAQLFAQKGSGIMSFFTSNTIGGLVARRLIPMVIYLPLIIGWLRLKGEELGFYEHKFGTALFGIAVISVLIIVILRNAKRLIHTDKLRIQIENALKESDERLRIIFDQAPHAMIVMDEKGIITKWNQRAEEIFGWTTEEVLGKVMHNIIIPERCRSMHLKGIEHFIKTGSGPTSNKTLELTALRKTGAEFPIDLRISFTKQNDQYLLIAFLNDITDRKKSSAELNKKSDDLKIANKELEQFAYVASHDLQEPLRTISNFVGLLEKKYKNNIDDTANEYIKFIVNATLKMRNLIKDILDLSRIGRNIAFTPVDTNELIKEVLSEMEATIVESYAKIRFTRLPLIQGNKLEIKLLFQNLISNAIKFRQKNVPVEITITAEEKEKEFQFAIKDNGIGIDQQYNDKIFIIFQRLHTSEEYPGTGIGLATCKKIILRHCGKIWFESEAGHGSIFYFTIQKPLQQLYHEENKVHSTGG